MNKRKNPNAPGQLHTDGTVDDGRDMVQIRVTETTTIKRHARVLVKIPDDPDDPDAWKRLLQEARHKCEKKLNGDAPLEGIAGELEQDPPDVKFSHAIGK